MMKKLFITLGFLCLIVLGCSENKDNPVIPDTRAPQVSITNPVSGSTLTEACDVKITATDDVGIEKVTVIIDGEPAETLTQSPFNFFWNVGYTADGKNHSILAVATDKAGNEGQSNIVSVTISTQAEIICVPVEPEDNTYHKYDEPVTFKWQKITDAVSYELKVVRISDFTTTMETTVINEEISDTVYTATELDPGKYEWTLRAKNKNGIYTKADSPLKFTKLLSQLPKPELVLPTNKAKLEISDEVKFSWKPVSDNVYYDFEISTDSTFSSTVNYYAQQDTVYFRSNVYVGKYFWRVRAKSFNAETSDWSEVYSFEVINSTWIVTLDRGLSDWGNEVIQTKDGNFVVVGPSYSDKDNYRADMWINKLDTKGNIIWQKLFGGEQSDFSNWIGETSEGNLRIVGGKGETYQMQVLQLSSNGTITKNYEYGTENDESWGYYGDFLDGQLIASGTIDKKAHVMRINENGVAEWSTKITDENGESAARGVAVDGNRDIGVITGEYFFILNQYGYIKKERDLNPQSYLNSIISVPYKGFLIPADDEIIMVDGYGWEEWRFNDGNEYDTAVLTDNGFAVCGQTGEDKVLVQEMNFNQEVLWKKEYLTGRATSIKRIAGGGFIVTGVAGVFKEDNADVFVMKIDKSGNVSQGLNKVNSYSSGSNKGKNAALNPFVK